MKRKRLISQTRSMKNDPNKDCLTDEVLDSGAKKKLKRLIEEGKYNPKEVEAQSVSEERIFDFPPYRVKVIRFDSQTGADGALNFNDASKLMRQSRWEIQVCDAKGHVKSTKTVVLPNGSDVMAILKLEAQKLIQQMN